MKKIGPAPSSAKTRRPGVVPAVAGLLVLAVFAVFAQTLRHDFVNYDDATYVYENPAVVRGLSGQGFEWACTSREASNWHPLTWLSHMLDCQLYGVSPWGHHLTNVLLHAATAVLLFLVLGRMTDDLWPSAFVAAVFAVHPLHVESVAWLAERKDILSGLFFALVLVAYLRYVRRGFSWTRYLTVTGLFALGLMCKPMLVTLPFVLLLLDCWPLGRLTLAPRPAAARGSRATDSRSFLAQARQLVVEKLPWFVLAAVSCVITLWAQQEAIQDASPLSLLARIGNAAISYLTYLGQMFYPANLAVFYPHPGANPTAWKVTAALAVLAAISAGVVIAGRRRPWLAVGWLWYVGMLLPVIGLVQVGGQSHADRYTYLPQIGLYVAIAWSAAHAVRSWRRRGWACGAAAALVAAALMGCTYHQTSYWRDSATLWTHALSCTSENVVAHCKFGVTLVDQGQIEQGIEEYRKALAIDPHSARAHNMLGEALQRRGDSAAAIQQYQAALELEPDNSDVHYNLGESWRQQGRLAEAIEQFQRSLALHPHRADAHTNLGAALGQLGRPAEAIEQFEKALAIDPARAEAHSNLGVTLAGLGRVDEAIEQYRAALQLKPDYAMAHNNLGVALATQGRLDEAIEQYREALQAQPDYGRARYNLDQALRRRTGKSP